MTEPAALLHFMTTESGLAHRICAWCDRPFTRRQTGGRDQRFCRASCRRALHAAARRWALTELTAGHLPLSAIKDGLPATRALAGMGGTPSPVPEAGETLDALLADLSALPVEVLAALPVHVLDQIVAHLNSA